MATVPVACTPAGLAKARAPTTTLSLPITYGAALSPMATVEAPLKWCAALAPMSTLLSTPAAADPTP